MKKQPLQLYKAIGLMSGTSMDGIDVAWIETDGLFDIRLLGHFSLTYEANFYKEMKTFEALMKANYLSVSEQEKENIHQKVDELNIKAIQGLCSQYNIHSKEMNNKVDIIGYHGQTVYHRPEKGMTIQMGNPQHIANKLRIPVMGHVRQNDVQLGGQGAPVAPIYHQALVIRDNLAPAMVINCGGISNVTLVTGHENTQLWGFDAGPGNGLLDRWVYEKTQGKESMDKDGKYALIGKIHQNVLDDLYAQSCIREQGNYYEQKPPKSLDIRDFNWTDSLSQLSLEDGCATLAAFTAHCIVDSFKFILEESDVVKNIIKNIILVGGGWHHPLILQVLKEKASKQYGSHIQVIEGDKITGWSSQYMEAELMAFLAVRCLHELPITFPLTTGVRYPAVGGEIFYP